MPTVDTGDTTFVLFSTALVLLMTPGLALFYGGLVRRKAVLNTMMMSFVAMGLVGVLWVLGGYSLAFSHGPGGLDAFIGGFAWLGLKDVGAAPNAEYAATIPHSAFMLFQCMFAVITPALVSGAIAERVKFKAFVLFTLLWSLVAYVPVAHWVWAPEGWLRKLGALDFAGGTVVHINAGVAALVAAVVVGKRKGFGRTPMIPHDIPLVLLGTGLLWFGWLGFNGGSALGANGLAANAFVVTFAAAAAGGTTWAVVEQFGHGKMTAVGFASGAVAGLVAITPASGFVGPLSALVFGVVASVASFQAIKLKSKLGYDDSLDVFGIHGVSGLLGAVLTGAFSSTTVNAAGADASPKLVGLQALAALVTIVYSGVVTYGILKLLSATVGLRVDEADEWDGVDGSEHGERAYADFDVAHSARSHAPEMQENAGGSALPTPPVEARA